MISDYTSSPIQGSPIMPFQKYPELPKELRLQVIEEAIKPFTRKDSHDPHDAHLSDLASIDLEWNWIIERRLFKTIRFTARDSDIIAFRNICSKRHALLSKIRLNLNVYSVPTQPMSDQESVVAVLAQLFDTMKDWTPETARGQHGLIQLEVCVVPRLRSLVSTASCDLGTFPEAPVIGAFSESPNSGKHFRLHHTILNTLHTKLPNLHSVRLPLHLEPSLHSTIESARSKHTTETYRPWTHY